MANTLKKGAAQLKELAGTATATQDSRPEQSTRKGKSSEAK